MDRLAQLRTSAGLSSSAASPGDGAAAYSPAENDQPVTVVHVTFADAVDEIDKDTADTLDAFYSDVDRIQGGIQDILHLTDQLMEKHTENIQNVDEGRAQALRGEIDQLSNTITERAKVVKDSLDAMSKNTATLKETPESVQANSAVVRIEENQYMHLVQLFSGAMGEYQRQQTANEAAYKAQTARQIKIKYTNEDGTAIDDATATQLAEQVMENNLTSYIFQQSKDVLNSIIETRNDIYRIEQSMRNLNQVFNDLAFLVYEQGELMDVILANVQASTRYVEKGRNELKRGRKLQKKSRKKMICIIVCVVVIALLFLLLGLLARFIPKKKSS